MKNVIKLFSVLFLASGAAGVSTLKAQTHDPAAVSIINSLIDNNGLTGYAKNDPANWDFAEWDNSTPKRLIELDFWYGGICLTGSVSFVGLTSLEYLDCDESNLTQLDVSGLTNLGELFCGYNNLTQLNVSGCTKLEFLACEENFLTELDVSNCENLEGLFCDYNNLTQLNVSGCTKLEVLVCEENHLTALDLTGLNALYEFYGDDQSVPLTLQENTAGNYTRNVSLNNPTFGNSAVTYSGGVLTSSSNTVASTNFTVQTGKNGYELSGIMYFTYGTVGIVETQCTASPRVYPNPTNGQLRITYAGTERVSSVQMYDVIGQVVFTSAPSSTSLETVIDISHLSAGLYFLKIDNKMIKVIKQ